MISSPSEIARRLADAFESAGITYAVGGALALGVWGFPRATLDVDINVFVALEDLASIYEILRRSGCFFDEASSTKRAIEDGQFEVHVGPMRIDVFIPSIPFYENVRRRIRQAPLEGPGFTLPLAPTRSHQRPPASANWRGPPSPGSRAPVAAKVLFARGRSWSRPVPSRPRLSGRRGPARPAGGLRPGGRRGMLRVVKRFASGLPFVTPPAAS